MRRGIPDTFHVVTAREYTRAGGDAHSLADQDVPFRAKDHVDARAKLDETDAFAGRDSVPGLLGADNAPRNQARDLFEHDACAVAFNGQRVLLVGDGRQFLARYQEPALLILDAGDGAADGGPVHVNIEDVQENTHALFREAFRPYRNHLAVSRRDGHRPSGDLPFRITEE